MKVTIVVGGRWHAFDLARELHEAGHLHRLITNYPGWFVKRWGIPKNKVVSLPLTFWAVKLIYKVGGERLMMCCQWRVHHWFAKRAAKYLEGSQLIHGWSQWSEPSLLWAKERDIPTVLERSSAHILEQSRLLREEHERLGLHWNGTHALIEAMEQREYGLCSAIAVPSLFVERSFLARGADAGHIFRNSLGVNLMRFSPPDIPPLSPLKVGLRVIYAGTLSVRKGIHDLVEGFRQADLSTASLSLIGGESPEMRGLLKQQDHQIEHLGHKPQHELTRHYQKAHCFVIASIEEGMAMVQMQALACGLPLICTTNTGGEDLLRLNGSMVKTHANKVCEYDAGFLVPIRKPEAIGWCLRMLGTQPELWEKKRIAAIELARASLSWQDYGKRAIKKYSQLIERCQ